MPVIRSAKMLTYRLFDVAFEIDLLKVEERITRETRRLKIRRKPFSKAFEFANPPVSFHLTTVQREIGGKEFILNVSARAYDYGVLSIIVEIPVQDMDLPSFELLAAGVALSGEIDGECRNSLDRAIAILGDALISPSVSVFEEDYTIYVIESFHGEYDVEEFFLTYDVSKLLLNEELPLSDRVKEELDAYRFSYYRNDCTILSWDSALIIEPTGETEVADILEFAHAQLLELRYYDHVVDKELDSIYEGISTKGVPSIWKIRTYERLAARVMRTIAELTEVTEKIDNSLKVTEDVYYAKIYMAALRLFRVKEWEAGIRRKLDLASRVYDMLYRDISTKRTELLELTIVVLIFIEIILFLK